MPFLLKPNADPPPDFPPIERHSHPKPCNTKPSLYNALVQIHHLGFFEDEQEAARVYDQAVVELRGAAAITNFPVEGAAAAHQAQLPGSCRDEDDSPSGPKPQESAEDLLARVVLAATLTQKAQLNQPAQSARCVPSVESGPLEM